MVTIHRQGGLRVMIFVDDHRLAHVHVFGSGEAKINLGDDDARTELLWAVGMSRSEVRRAVAVVTEHKETSLARWRQIHG